MVSDALRSGSLSKCAYLSQQPAYDRKALARRNKIAGAPSSRRSLTSADGNASWFGSRKDDSCGYLTRASGAVSWTHSHLWGIVDAWRYGPLAGAYWIRSSDHYLADSTVAANIAFGIPEDTIDIAAVERAACGANLHEFIFKELPERYYENWRSRCSAERRPEAEGRHRPGPLSGTGISDFGRATSALDGITEDVVMEAVNGRSHRKTLLIIAHRISTLKECDEVYLLANGKFVAHGTYEELLRSNADFRAMPKVSENAA
jgi:hypothetical protein